jgi:hypothetical protein
MNVKSVLLDNVTISEAIRIVRATYHIPVSFIESSLRQDNSKKIYINLQNVRIKDVLDSVKDQAKGYTYGVVENHLIIYPQSPKYSLEVTGVTISSTPRVKAADEYAKHLREHFEDFKGFAGSIMRGQPNAPLYTEQVSLKPSGTVLEHLAQLLGRSQAVVFSIVHTQSSAAIIIFEEIE